MIKVKKVDPNAKIPVRANPDDAGADLFSVENVTIPPLSRALISTGITIEIPSNNLYARVAPRSGLALKHGIDVLAGVIDKGYRGVIGVILYNTDSTNSFEVKVGDRIAQLILENAYVLPFGETQELDNSSRGNSGFGSTGIN